jgi:7,8-dihydropterin-6-yl-methyl-4-(beta-D-ribofuranosyl)aminobenzene 5'-phosphate synthase
MIDVHVAGPEPCRLAPGVFSTGMLGSQPPEQGMALDIEGVTAAISGCAHPGMERIVERAARLLGQPVGWAIGGFHLMYADAAAIDQTICALQHLGVTHVVPTHCTGDAAKAAFHRAFGARCLEGGVGREIQLVGRGRLDLEPAPEA